MPANNAYTQYGQDTLRIVRSMEDGNFQEMTDGSNCVFYPGVPGEVQPVLIYPSYVTVAERVYSAKREGETNRQYAERLNHHAPQLSQYCSIQDPRKLHQDTIVQIVMRYDRIPAVEDVDHILMELNQPQLHTDTCDADVNRRNLVIRRVLEVAQVQTESGKPEKDWFALLCAALKYFKLSPMRHGIRDAVLSEADMAWLDKWKPELLALNSHDYTIYRRELLEKYGSAYGSTHTAAFDHIYQRLLVDEADPALTPSPELIATCFHSRMDIGRNRLARSSLVKIFIALGCTIDEINRVLWEANHPILYPKYGDPEEREFCRRAARNSH